VLVYGASGSIGTAAVQLAQALGAEVTAVCNIQNLELVRSLGADAVIDYMRQDLTENGKAYDVIFDAVGKESFLHCRGALRPGGRYVFADGWTNVAWLLVTGVWGQYRVIFASPRRAKSEVLAIKQLIETGRYRPVIDRTYPLQDIVDAARYVATEQKTGNVVLTVRRDGDG
jgi:NADPH:quinone reductase-like Zn-dependent oxidoreductase